MKVREYMVIQDYSLEAFCTQVRDWINSGWQPLGGVAVASSDTGRLCYYVQAMILPESDTTEKEGLASLEDLMLGNGWANVESESTLAHMKRQLDAMADERDYWKAMTDGEEVIDVQRQEISRLREALTWAVGFIRCQHPNAYLEYEDMRNAAALVCGDMSIWSGEFHRVSCRAEVAEYERDRLKKQLDNILAMTGMVVHAAEPECTAARCGCVSLSPEEAVAEVLVRNGIKPLGVKR